jgi:hypothetical protein
VVKPKVQCRLAHHHHHQPTAGVGISKLQPDIDR